MNPSYGDSTNGAHGRARVPDPGGGYDPDAERDAGYGPSRRDGTGVVGTASVRPVSPPPAAAGRASVGRASVGSAPVAGRASVGGRAGALTGPGGPGVLDPVEVPGGPAGPRGPRGPGGPGEGRGRGPKGPRSKRTRRRNIILASVAVFIIVAGLIVVGGTYYYDSVPEPNQIALPESTTVYYSDKTTPMAKLGDQNRTIIPRDQIPRWVQQAVVAAEDNSFYDNKGIDFKGIVRAAWNNVTGGSRQGASTITQQYVRNAFDLQGVSYARKVREAVMAVKINQKYGKDEVMGFYLNTVYFGRGCYGIEAAAEAYFGKHASELTVAEGMVLASVIKQPEGTDGFDPGKNLANAQDRWNNYVRPNMVKLGFLKPEAAAALTYPTNIIKPDSSSTGAAQFGKDTPTGFVVHHVMDELSHQTDVNLGNLKTQGYKIITTIDKRYEDAAIAIADQGTKGSIMSTQPARLQAALVSIEPGTGRVLAYYGGPNGSGYDNAGIYSDPVLENGDPAGLHFSPGSTMKVYTMTTALSQHISIDSYWDGPPSKVFPGRGDDYAKAHHLAGPVTNSDGDACPKPTYVCTMQYALQVSTNTVFYGVGQVVHPDKVIDMAHGLGIDHIWAPVTDPATGATHDQRYDLDKYKGADIYPSKLGGELAIGQYGITVEDNATGLATLAARGVHTKTHFVDYVMKGSQVVYKARTQQTTPEQIGLTKEEVDDATWAMSTVIDNGLPKNRLSGGRKAASKTGTWELCHDAASCKAACQAPTCKGKTSANSDAWYAGFTPQLATVVHIGSKDPKDRSIAFYDRPGHEANMNGANTPGDIWKKFMDTVLAGKQKVALPTPKHVGRVDAGNAASPEPAPSTEQGNGGGNPTDGGGGQPCVPPQPCVSLPPTPDPSPSRKHPGG